MGKPVVLIIAPDLSTRALVEASIDPDAVQLVVTHSAAQARQALATRRFDLVVLDDAVEAAGSLLVEGEAITLLLLGSETGALAEHAARILAKPLEVLALQTALAEQLELKVTAITDHVTTTGAAAVRALETERDTLQAELTVCRHESDGARRAMEDDREVFRQTITSLEGQLATERANLRRQRRTAAALQTACGEVEQAHGALLQRYEALEAERDALAERARDVSVLREQLERAQRDRTRAERAFEAVSGSPGSVLIAAAEEAGW